MVSVRGRVTALAGWVVRATAPGARVGAGVEVVDGPRRLPAEVVGLDHGEAVLLPHVEPSGLGLGARVELSSAPFTLRCGDALLGHVLDAEGTPVDAELPAHRLERWSLERDPPPPLARPRIDAPLPLGIRVVDGLLTLGRGQRIGLFAGSGVGKSRLLGQIARRTAADVVVACLVGERGREVREFVESTLGPEGRARSVVVQATSDQSALLRRKAAFVATAIAEWFRDRDLAVLLMMDSLTRFARAQREIGLAAGEPPVRQGYPASVFSELPRLLERAGPAPRGSITAVYTVLVAGDDLEEPIADEVRGLLDGHLVLDRGLAARRHHPAVDLGASVSRLMDRVTSPQHAAQAARFVRLVTAYERQRDLIAIGAYVAGSDRETDEALARWAAIEAFLRQAEDERSPWEETMSRLDEVLA